MYILVWVAVAIRLISICGLLVLVVDDLGLPSQLILEVGFLVGILVVDQVSGGWAN